MRSINDLNYIWINTATIQRAIRKYKEEVRRCKAKYDDNMEFARTELTNERTLFLRIRKTIWDVHGQGLMGYMMNLKSTAEKDYPKLYMELLGATVYSENQYDGLQSAANLSDKVWCTQETAAFVAKWM